MGPLPQPYGPPPTQPSLEKKTSSRWLLWVIGILAFLCLVAVVIAAVFIVPKYLPGGGETLTPTPTLGSPTVTPSETPSPTDTLVPPTATSAPQPTTTEAAPTPPFEAQITIVPSTSELQVGETLTITVMATNSGQVAFGEPRYQVFGTWESHLELLTDVVIERVSDLSPNQSEMVIFVFKATQPGSATLQANVTVKTRHDPPSTESITSDSVEVAVTE
jgi:hypothetical protein